MFMQRLALSLVLLAGLTLLAGVGTAEAAEFKSTQGWLLGVDQTSGLIQLAMSPSNPSQVVTLSVNQWVLEQCLRRLETRKAFDIWMDVTICPGSKLGCTYSYGFRPKG